MYKNWRTLSTVLSTMDKNGRTHSTIVSYIVEIGTYIFTFISTIVNYYALLVKGEKHIFFQQNTRFLTFPS